MIKAKYILIILIFAIANINATNKISCDLRDMEKRISKDKSSIHKIWELQNIKIISKGMIGIGSEMKTLDLRDKDKLYMGEPSDKSVGFPYKLEGDFLIIIFENSDDPIFRITKLTTRTLVLTLCREKKDNKSSFEDLIEFHYENIKK